MLKLHNNVLAYISHLENGHTFFVNCKVDYWNSSFGGWKINKDKPEEYEFWRNVLRNIMNKSPEEAMDSQNPIPVKAIEDVHGNIAIVGLGNSDGSYWIVRDDNRKALVLDKKEAIDKFFEEHDLDIPYDVKKKADMDDMGRE